MSSGSTTSVLTLENLHKEFAGIVAVDHVTLDINGGQITAIIGPNGAGKTTLINLITGQLRPTDGTISFNGRNVTGLSEAERVREGLVKSFQIPQIFEEMSLIENLYACLVTKTGRNSDFVHPLGRDPTLKDEASAILADFGLDQYGDVRASELPHGARKILDTAMAVALDPTVILLDEPTSGVSSSEKDTVIETILQATESSDVTTVFIEHDLELVAEYAERVIAMHRGSILIDGSPEEVLSAETTLEHIQGEGV